MPCVDAIVECPVYDSFRVQQVAGMFDLPLAEKARERFSVEVPSIDEPWQIGAIVGPSGSGKSTIARAAFGEAIAQAREWPADCAVIDAFGDAPAKQITHVLTAVGMSSPPSWIKPYAVLSGGEKFRCDLARALVKSRELRVEGPEAEWTSGSGPSTLDSGLPLVVFDEFTSVVDRTVARVGSAAVSKAIRKRRVDCRFVAVTCHYDVLEWLESDWVVDMATCTLSRRRLRRPRIDIEICRTKHEAWRMFGRHHYLSRSLNKAAHCYLASWNNEPVAFCAVLAMPGRKGRWRISRIVVLPDYQGIGIGLRMISAVAAHYRSEQKRMNITTSHPAMIRALADSTEWKTVALKKTGFGVQQGARSGVLTGYVTNTSHGRAVASFEFCPSFNRDPTGSARGVL